MLDVKYGQLEVLRQVVKTAQELEKSDHRKLADEKAASWVLKTAKDAELVLDEDLKHEVQTKLAGKKRKRGEADLPEELDENEQPLFRVPDDSRHKDRDRGKQREQALKQKYDKHHESLMLKRFSKSSFLTPESAAYLNEAIKSSQSKLDQELVYAGLHSDKVPKLKFKRKNKNQQRFKNRTKRSQTKRKNRHAA